jgi:hypothetical protein
VSKTTPGGWTVTIFCDRCGEERDESEFLRVKGGWVHNVHPPHWRNGDLFLVTKIPGLRIVLPGLAHVPGLAPQLPGLAVRFPAVASRVLEFPEGVAEDHEAEAV